MADYGINTGRIVFIGLLSVILTVAAVMGLQALFYWYEAGLEPSADRPQPAVSSGSAESSGSAGKPVTLKQYFDGERPVVLTLNYSNCPMLCSPQLNGLFDALKEMKWGIGGKFEMVTVGIDPLETPERARMTKQKYLKIYRRAGAAEGYHFLTGPEENIKKVADAVGFHYRYDPKARQYLHTAVTMILTPEGRVSRYLYGVQYDPQTLTFRWASPSD